ncbi:class I SAM-dependent methyltransferase [Candidatus Latescibacterota bacterium]
MKRKLGFYILFFVFLWMFVSDVFGQLDVRYEPTSYEIVDQMLELAKVTENDILYDLGCGDGRIVITAAKKFRTRGTGIDLDPLRIKESRENAVKEKVTGIVSFKEQNLFESDFSEATVVTLYLLPWVNLKLRPKLFHDLRPGTRIVSHEHYMDEWLPDRKLEIKSGGRIHDVYFWILPSNVSGLWVWTTLDDNEEQEYILNLSQNFQYISGDITALETSFQIKEATLEGNRIQFTYEDRNGDQPVIYSFGGIVDDNSINGTVSIQSETESHERTWTAKRDPSTVIPIDNRPLP